MSTRKEVHDMNRTQKILAGVLVLQIVLAAIVLWPKPAQTAAAPILGAIKQEDITDLTVSDNAGLSYHLQRTGEGWVLADRGNYPAIGETVDSLIENLLKIDTARLVSQTAESHRQLKVAEDEFERKVVIKTADGKEQTLLLGTMSGMAANNIRLLPGNEVYLARDVSAYGINMSFSSWAINKLVEADSAKVTAVNLVNGNGEFDFKRIDASNWEMTNLPAGEQFNNGAMTNILIRAASFSFYDVIGTKDTMKPEYGLTNPAGVLTVKIEDDNPRTVKILLGAPAPDGQNYYGTADDSNYIVLVNKSMAEHFLLKKLTDFVVQPTAVPTVSPTP